VTFTTRKTPTPPPTPPPQRDGSADFPGQKLQIFRRGPWGGLRTHLHLYRFTRRDRSTFVAFRSATANAGAELRKLDDSHLGPHGIFGGVGWGVYRAAIGETQFGKCQLRTV